jgi:hypothetical protein
LADGTSRLEFPHDEGLVAVLRQFGRAPHDLLGHGGEAWVYALDEERVLRVLHDGGTPTDVTRRVALVEALSRSKPPYLLPEVLELGAFEERTYAIERRLPGRPVTEELGHLEGVARARLIEAYLETSASLGDLCLPSHAGYGELIGDDPIVAPTWRGYLHERAARNLAGSTPDLQRVNPEGIADGLPDTSTPSFVHLDAFAGNLLTDNLAITAVLDIGSSSLAGDRRLDPIASTVYLSDPHVTPTATARDVEVAESWLRSNGLGDWLEPGRRWLAAYWSFAINDPKLIAWCRHVLLG